MRTFPRFGQARMCFILEDEEAGRAIQSVLSLASQLCNDNRARALSGGGSGVPTQWEIISLWPSHADRYFSLERYADTEGQAIYGGRGRLVYADGPLDLLALSMAIPGARSLRYGSDDTDCA